MKLCLSKAEQVSIGVVVASAALLLSGAPKAYSQPAKRSADFGLGASMRQVRLTRGLAKLFTDDAPPGTRTEGYSVEFARRGKQLEFVLGFGYDDLQASTGYYLQSAGDPLVPGQVDYTNFRGFHWYTIDATLIGYLRLHKILSFRYGAGLGIGIMRGSIKRTDALCTSSNLRRDCLPDPMGAQQSEPIKIPKVLPVLLALAGIQFRPLKAVAINLDVGLRTVPYVSASVMFYLW